MEESFERGRVGKMTILPNWGNGKKVDQQTNIMGKRHIIIIRRAEGTINTIQLTYTPCRILKNGAHHGAQKKEKEFVKQKRNGRLNRYLLYGNYENAI